MTVYYGDISSYDTGISLKGLLAVACKATESTNYANPDYVRARQAAAASGTFFMAYHFLHGGNGAAQAAWCYLHVGKTPLMLDVEANGATLADTETFVSAYRKLGGVVHLVYLPHWYWQQIGSPSIQAPFSRMGQGMYLVSSAYTGYTDANSGVGWQAYGGIKPTIWQYTDTMSFNGFSIDFNAFRGQYAGKQDAVSVQACLAELKSIASTGKFPGTTPTPPPPDPAATAYRVQVPAGNTRSLDGVAAARGATVDGIVSFSLGFLNSANTAILEAYDALDKALAAKGHPHPAMPEGLIYYTRNK